MEYSKKKMTIGFNADVYEKSRRREKLIDQWVVMHYQNHLFVGKVQKIDEGKIVLMPYKGWDYSDEGESEITIIPDRELEVNFKDERVGLEKVTENWVMNRIKSENLELKSQKEKKSKN